MRVVRCATAARKTFCDGARLWIAGVWCSARGYVKMAAASLAAGSSQSNQRASESGAGAARIEPVAEAVGEHVEAQHREHDGEPRADDHPRRVEHETAAVGEHEAERRRRRPDAHAEE